MSAQDTVPYISIHAPREGSDPGLKAVTAFVMISIHAPREGSDRRLLSRSLTGTNFYPRSPRGERRLCGKTVDSCAKFLSTLPARGATEEIGSYMMAGLISIHAPREGSDNRAVQRLCHCRISIHAPREGSDGRRHKGRAAHHHFYPRSPRGERHTSRASGHGTRPYFYPRSPRGERLNDTPPVQWTPKISIHAPREGSDVLAPPVCLGERGISIHAPREGSDILSASASATRPYFYPRSPRGERHYCPGNCRWVTNISIHAPREGSDLRALADTVEQNQFLSTLPARGATIRIATGISVY